MIKKLVLNKFKKHEHLSLNDLSKINVIWGPNGAGKTSILEALSLFSPGKGGFNLKIEELPRLDSDSFEVFVQSDFDSLISYAKGKKTFILDGDVKKPLELLENFRISVLTPYLFLAFWKDLAIRRQVFDRFIMQMNSEYAQVYAKYDKALKERNLLIKNESFNSTWAEILDPIIIKNGIEINNIRRGVVNSFNEQNCLDTENFLKNDLKIDISPSFDEMDSILQKYQAKGIHDDFLGPHRVKFNLSCLDFDGKMASTGQQKKLLISFFMKGLPDSFGFEKILLLDDILSYLDNEAKSDFFNLLDKKDYQVFISDINKFEINSLDVNFIGLE
jgi:DNA replication and repair protein RecF